MKIFLIAHKGSILTGWNMRKDNSTRPTNKNTKDDNGFCKILKESLTSNWPSEKCTVL